MGYGCLSFSHWMCVAEWKCMKVGRLLICLLTLLAFGANADDETVEKLLPLANDGDVSAQVRLGDLYATGHGVETNLVEAFKCFEKAAEKGSAGAQYLLGAAYQFGTGTVTNSALAVKWYRAAAEQNLPEAQYGFGWALIHGVRVERDPQAGEKWIRKA